MACEYALCSVFVPGDRQIILGTKVVKHSHSINKQHKIIMGCVVFTDRRCFLSQSGKLQIFELASGSLLETVDAHSGALWSLCLAPDQVMWILM